jgi:predicted nucleotidyltransferase
MSIADFLITPVQQRLLAPLLLHPESSYSLSDLLRVAGSGRGNTQRLVTNLVHAGVLREQRQGNQRRLQVDTAFPLYPELRSICLKTFGIADRLGRALAPLSSHIVEAFVYGSVARNEDTAGSDIDLMVIGDVGLTAVLDPLAPLEAELGRPIHVTLYNEAEWIHLQKHDSVVAAIAKGPRIEVKLHAAS